jgi:hypothetical protein
MHTKDQPIWTTQSPGRLSLINRSGQRNILDIRICSVFDATQGTAVPVSQGMDTPDLFDWPYGSCYLRSLPFEKPARGYGPAIELGSL